VEAMSTTIYRPNVIPTTHVSQPRKEMKSESINKYIPSEQQMKELEDYISVRLAERLAIELNKPDGIFQTKLPITSVEQSVTEYVNELRNGKK
jgi:hypothetical protein